MSAILFNVHYSLIFISVPVWDNFYDYYLVSWSSLILTFIHKNPATNCNHHRPFHLPFQSPNHRGICRPPYRNWVGIRRIWLLMRSRSSYIKFYIHPKSVLAKAWYTRGRGGGGGGRGSGARGVLIRPCNPINFIFYYSFGSALCWKFPNDIIFCACEVT